jgi:predicted polyphosphate/ATP-dependent NAD kinase
VKPLAAPVLGHPEGLERRFAVPAVWPEACARVPKKAARRSEDARSARITR